MFKKPKLLPPIRTYEEDYIWEADLMFFTHPAIAKENNQAIKHTTNQTNAQ